MTAKRDFRKNVDWLFNEPDVKEDVQQDVKYDVKDDVRYDVRYDVKEVDPVRAAQEAHCTQGRKGMSMPRVSIALAPSRMEYVKSMSAAAGKSITRYISDLIDADAAVNADQYNALQKSKPPKSRNNV